MTAFLSLVNTVFAPGLLTVNSDTIWFSYCVPSCLWAISHTRIWVAMYSSSGLPPYLVPVSVLYPRVNTALMSSFCSWEN